MEDITPKADIQYQEFITVHVGDAEIRTTKTDKYSIYSVTLKTNSLSFSAPHTRVYRRYSDFLWLQRRLKKIPKLTSSCRVPNMPPKQFSFWNFDKDFLHGRKQSLQEFLKRIMEETLFLSSTAFHLFIQTEIPVPEMEEVIAKGCSDAAIAANLMSVEVDNKFLESLQANVRHSRDSEHSPSGKARDISKGRCPVYWRCRKNTMNKVASLPHFSTLLRQCRGSDGNDADTDKSAA